MKIVLLVFLFLAGQEQPMTDVKEMPSMKACEASAHKYNATKLPDNTIIAYAACARMAPRPPGEPS